MEASRVDPADPAVFAEISSGRRPGWVHRGHLAAQTAQLPADAQLGLAPTTDLPGPACGFGKPDPRGPGGGVVQGHVTDDSGSHGRTQLLGGVSGWG